MKVLVKPNCSINPVYIDINVKTEREFYAEMGCLLFAMKLTKDYCTAREIEVVTDSILEQFDSENMEEFNRIGPEGFAEDWLKYMGINSGYHGKVMQYFFQILSKGIKNGKA